MNTNLQQLQQRIQNSFDRQQYSLLLKSHLDFVEPGRVSITCRKRPELTQQQGAFHNGVVASIADTACGYTAMTVVSEEQKVLTVECKMNFLHSATGNQITAIGNVVKTGKSLIITETEVIDTESGALIAKMLATMTRVIPSHAKSEQQSYIDIFDVKERLAPCGLHCGKCFAFQEGEIHNAAVRLQKYLGNFAPYAQRFAEQLDPIFEKYPAFAALLDYLVDASCGGCRLELCKFYKNCPIRTCTSEKQIDFCCECPDFPCEHTGLDENLFQRFIAINQRIGKIGPKAYYQEIQDKPRY